MIKITEIVRK